MPCSVYADPGGDHAPSPGLSTVAGWGPTSAPPALSQCLGRQSPSAGSGQTDAPDRGTGPPPGGRVRGGQGRDAEGAQSGREGERSQSGRESRGGSRKSRGGSREASEVLSHGEAVKSSDGRRSSAGRDDPSVEGRRSRDPSPEDRRRSRDPSLEDRLRACDLSARHMKKSGGVPLEHRRQSCDSVSLSLSESRDLSLEEEQDIHDPDPFGPSDSSRDLSLEQQRSSRDTDSAVSPEAVSDQRCRSEAKNTRTLSNSAAKDSVTKRRSISRERMSNTGSRSRGESSEDSPKFHESFPAGSDFSRISESSIPSRSPDIPLACRSRSHVSVADGPTKSRDRLISSLLEPSAAWRRRRRSSSDPGYGRRGVSPSPPAAETAETAEQPASRDRLQGVLSVLASQVEVIQAMVGRRGRSSRAARRCRSLSRRISRNRVSASPGSLVDRVEVAGVPVSRRSGRRVARCRSEKTDSGSDPSLAAGRRLGSVDWTGGQGGGEAVEPGSDEDRGGPGRERDGPEINGDGSESPPRWSGGRGSAETPPGPVRCRRRRHPAGVGPAPEPTPPGRRSAHPSSGRRITDRRPPAERNTRHSGTDPGHQAPPAGTERWQEAPSAGTERWQEAPSAGSRGGDSTGRHQRTAAVPPLPLSGLESEQGDGVGSYCSLESPRTVSPTRKVS